MQEDKEQVFDAADHLMLALAAMEGMVRDMTANVDGPAKRRRRPGFPPRPIWPTGWCASWACRSARRITSPAALVALAEAQGLRPAGPDAGGDAGRCMTGSREGVFDVLGVQNSVASRVSLWRHRAGAGARADRALEGGHWHEMRLAIAGAAGAGQPAVSIGAGPNRLDERQSRDLRCREPADRSVSRGRSDVSPLRMIYLALAIWGAVHPMVLVRRLLAGRRGLARRAGRRWHVNAGSTGLVWDLTIAAIALTVWIVAETRVRRNWSALLGDPGDVLHRGQLRAAALSVSAHATGGLKVSGNATPAASRDVLLRALRVAGPLRSNLPLAELTEAGIFPNRRSRTGIA